MSDREDDEWFMDEVDVVTKKYPRLGEIYNRMLKRTESTPEDRRHCFVNLKKIAKEMTIKDLELVDDYIEKMQPVFKDWIWAMPAISFDILSKRPEWYEDIMKLGTKIEQNNSYQGYSLLLKIRDRLSPEYPEGLPKKSEDLRIIQLIGDQADAQIISQLIDMEKPQTKREYAKAVSKFY